MSGPDGTLSEASRRSIHLLFTWALCNLLLLSLRWLNQILITNEAQLLSQ